MPIAVITTESDLKSALAGLSSTSAPSLVPTMGALHAGHAALIRRARETAGVNPRRQPVVVSLFVNPTQFGPNEDFMRYPRQKEQDIALCEESGADIVFTPSVQTMYPAGLEDVAEGFVMPPLPTVATLPQLEDASRPTHFAGVCKVVARLFDIVQPAHAFFGEKDYQQLRVTTEMAREQSSRWRDLNIIACPTVREDDGLAMSSRNAYLTPEQRKPALSLWRALSEAKQEQTPAAALDVMRVMLEEASVEIEYAAVRDAQTLMPVETFERPCRALIAVRVPGNGEVNGGGVRLIDNMAVEGK